MDIDFHENKVIKDIEIDKIIQKYDDASFVKPPSNKNGFGLLSNVNSFKRESDKQGSTAVPVEIEQGLNSKNKTKVPALNLNVKNNIEENQGEINEEFIFDPVTERECSFINNISVDNSNFMGDENKENDVVLCISNLDIDINGKKYSHGHQITVLNSESQLINKSEKLDDQEKKDLSSINGKQNDKKKLIDSSAVVSNKYLCTTKRIIVCIGLFLVISIGVAIITSVLKL